MCSFAGAQASSALRWYFRMVSEGAAAGVGGSALPPALREPLGPTIVRRRRARRYKVNRDPKVA